MPSDSPAETRRLRALMELSRSLIHPIDPHSLFANALKHAAELLDAKAGTLRLLDRHGCLTCAATHGAPPGYLDAHLRVRAEAPELQYALEVSGPVCFGSELALPELTALVPGGAGGSVLAPVAAQGHVVGLMSLIVSEPRELSEAEFLTLKAIAELAGVGELNERSFSHLERASRTDPLTGLSTRRHFEELLRRELARARRQQRPISLAILDVDQLKWINDTHGHVVGDRVLACVGELLQSLRATDVAARLGGDEFAILMPDTSASDAEVVIRRFRERLAEVNASRPFPFTLGVSIGVRELGFPDEDLVAAADAAMYEHKRQAQFSPEPLVDEEDRDEAEQPFRR